MKYFYLVRIRIFNACLFLMRDVKTMKFLHVLIMDWHYRFLFVFFEDLVKHMYIIREVFKI